MPKRAIVIRNAHQNNLKSLDLSLPLGELVVVTGVSGSGKSTLAFDTIYAEGQRRYVETFSPYARQFLDRMDKPKVDSIEGIPPAIAIDQVNPVRTSRSTVGTMTELNDYIKMLFARAADLYCHGCGKQVSNDSAQSIADEWLADSESGKRVMVTFSVPVPANFKKEEIEEWLARQGYTRIHQRRGKTLEVIQDRLRLDDENRGRFIEAIEAALRYGQGHVTVYPLDESREALKGERYTTALQCGNCNLSFQKSLPSLFSFNSPIGACESCRGFGRTMGIDYGLVIPDESLTLKQGAIKVWQTKTNAICQRDMEKFAEQEGVPLDKPWSKLSSKHQRWVIEGQGTRNRRRKTTWYGINGFFKWLEGRAYKMHVRVMLSKYRSYEECESCGGARLKPEALYWRVGTLEDVRQVIKPADRFVPLHNTLATKTLLRMPGFCLHDIMTLSITDAEQFFRNFRPHNNLDDAMQLLLDEVRSRLRYLVDVGLGYLSLDRQSRTLSGGEVQRINLTTAIGTSLVNTLFVLDEPSIGLHARDMDRVTQVLQRLRDAGNTLIVVEHDPQLMFAADRIIDMGPEPGKAGGNIVFNGSPAQLLKNKKSLTADYLSGRKRLTMISDRNPDIHKPLLATDTSGALKAHTKSIHIKGACAHNLKNLSLQIPLGKLVCITGPSGSGKSTLVQDTLYRALKKMKGQPVESPGEYRSIDGHEAIDDVVLVDQTPIGKSARSNPVSYTGAFDGIRKLFEREPEAKNRGLTAGAFSFNSGMRCPACSGNGFEHVEMQFLSDVYLRCGECLGRRYRPELLEIKVFSEYSSDGKSIADVLDMTVEESLEFFKDEADIMTALQPLSDVGLGYLQLGQPVPTLSGGEAQRLKLAAHLGKGLKKRSTIKKKISKKGASKKTTAKSKLSTSSTTGTLFLFDEPTTGLHFHDIEKLLSAFQQLLSHGHSLIVIEHNLDVIGNAEWVIDLGPDGGDAGGALVFAGTPQALRKKSDSDTAHALISYDSSIKDLQSRGHTNNYAEPVKQIVPAGKDMVRDAVSEDHIVIQQAREHNLKNINVEIPRDKFTVITGMSGSGKSTLAFDIVFNEGQRRYLESLNAYARQFVQPAARPDVDALHGIPPTVAIEQRTSRGGFKSTVATMTEIYHFLRLLFVKLGVQHCPDCDVPISAQTVEAITAQIMKKWRDKRVRVYAPMVTNRKGYYTDLAKWAQKKGFTELRVDGDFLPTDNWPRLDRFREHNIELPVGELTVKPKDEQSLVQLLQRALDFGKGVVLLEAESNRKNAKPILFSITRACPECQTSFRELDPRMFSYNSLHGWCTECFGTGRVVDGFDEEQSGEEAGWMDTEAEVDCPQCEGQRLCEESLNVFFKNNSIADYAALSVEKSVAAFDNLKLTKREATIANDVLSELNTRLHFLNEVGLSYLTLDRAAPTLSGGEAQRIRLAAQLGSNLRGVCYILDEPTIGLHPRDNRMLLDTLNKLGEKGNTIVVVEHDEDTILNAEHIIDIGPGAGVRGGEVVATGSVAKIKKNKQSATGRMLANPLIHPIHQRRKNFDHWLKIEAASLNNLKSVDADIPLGALVCVSGVSGSGKSTLVREVLHDNLRCLNGKTRNRKLGKLHGCKAITGWQPISRVLEVDQTPIGKTPRSCPATYIGFWDNIRRVFADATEARIRGFSPSRFSFNVKGGRCDECDGQGIKRIEMNFLPDVKIPCDVCGGERFNSETLSVRFRNKSIGDVLSMDVDEAVEFFSAHQSIHHPLKLLQAVGLGYLTLGQQSPTLSGGEAQRIKLVSELAKAKPILKDNSGRSLSAKHTLYILDEPTVGLHMADVERLIHVLHELVDSGNSVVVIEHNLDIMAEADWLLDLGPEGGEGGGKVIAKGTPEKISESRRSRTAPFLKAVLQRSANSGKAEPGKTVRKTAKNKARSSEGNKEKTTA